MLIIWPFVLSELHRPAICGFQEINCRVEVRSIDISIFGPDNFNRQSVKRVCESVHGDNECLNSGM